MKINATNLPSVRCVFLSYWRNHLIVVYYFLFAFSPPLWSREGNGTPLQYSCLENPMDGGAWQAVVHGVTKSRTRLSDFTFTFHFHALEKEMATHSSVLAWRIPGTGSLVGCRLWGRSRTRLKPLGSSSSSTRFVPSQPVSHCRNHSWLILLSPPFLPHSSFRTTDLRVECFQGVSLLSHSPYYHQNPVCKMKRNPLA